MALQKDFPKGATKITLGLTRVFQMNIDFFAKTTTVNPAYFVDEDAAESDHSGPQVVFDELPPDGVNLVEWAEAKLMAPIGKDDKGADIPSKFADAAVVSAKPLPDPVAAASQ